MTPNSVAESHSRIRRKTIIATKVPGASAAVEWAGVIEIEERPGGCNYPKIARALAEKDFPGLPEIGDPDISVIQKPGLTSFGFIIRPKWWNIPAHWSQNLSEAPD